MGEAFNVEIVGGGRSKALEEGLIAETVCVLERARRAMQNSKTGTKPGSPSASRPSRRPTAPAACRSTEFHLLYERNELIVSECSSSSLTIAEWRDRKNTAMRLRLVDLNYHRLSTESKLIEMFMLSRGRARCGCSSRRWRGGAAAG